MRVLSERVQVGVLPERVQVGVLSEPRLGGRALGTGRRVRRCHLALCWALTDTARLNSAIF